MSRIVPITPASVSSAHSAIPQAVVKGRRPHPFGLLFSGRWRFDGNRNLWRPRMNLVNLIPGCNGVIELGRNERGLAVINAGSYTDKAAKTPLARFFVTGDRRLGDYADFQRVFTVKTPGGRHVPHYALPCETYHKDAHGRIGRGFDHAWLDGLFDHAVKAGLIPPMDYGAFEDARDKLRREIDGLRARAQRRSAHREELIDRVDELKLRLDKMTSAFDQQFPDAQELWRTAEKEGVEDEGGPKFDSDDEAL